MDRRLARRAIRRVHVPFSLCAVLVLGGCLSERTLSDADGEGPQHVELPSVDPLRPASVVVLLAIDGLVPEGYAPDRPSEMPNLWQLARRGVSADRVRPVTPASEYPAHAALLTGVRPGRHGVVSDLMLGTTGVRTTNFFHASQVQGESLWQLAQSGGYRVAAIGWPSTVGASIEWLLPGLLPTRTGETWGSVLEDVASPWILEQVRTLAPELLASQAPPAWARDALTVELACQLVSSVERPRLLLMRWAQLADALERYGPGSQQAALARARVDGELGRLLRCFGEAELLEELAIVIVGDRAILPVHTRVDPNVALRKAGLISP